MTWQPNAIGCNNKEPMKGMSIFGVKITSYLAAVVVLISIGSCQTKDYFKAAPTLVASPNPMVKSLQFDLLDSVQVAVRVRELNSDKVFTFGQVSKAGAQSVLLAGLPPNRDYVVEFMDGSEVVSEGLLFHTAAIDSTLVQVTEKVNTGNAFDGYILTQKKGQQDGLVYMVNNASEVVWYQPTPRIPKLSHLTASHEVAVLVGNPKVNNSAGDRIIGYTFDGGVSFDIDLAKKHLMAHHEVIDHDGDLFALVYDTIPNQVGGSLEQAVSSAVIRMNRKGEILWKWSTFDVVLPEGVPVKEMDGDWGHANALAFDSDQNLLISYRDWNQVWKIDVNTGERMWVLGEGGDYEMDGPPFDYQHAIIKDPDGHYMLFDNGRQKRQTRVVSYRLGGGKAELVRDMALPQELFSVKMGNAQVLPNGNILVCSSGKEAMAVLDASGQILYQAGAGIPVPYRATYVPPFFSSN